MIRAMVLLLVPLISLGIYNSGQDSIENKSWLKQIVLYAGFFLFNLTSMTGILFLRGHSLAVIDANMNSIGFLFKYLILSCIIAVLAPIVYKKVLHMKIKIKIIKEE